MNLFLFGQAGSGKSYVGTLLQRRFGFHFHDADWDLPPALHAAVASHQPITEDMRYEFTEAIVQRIVRLRQEHQRFVVAQALFKNRHRERLRQAFPDLHFVWIRAPRSLLLERLRKRVGHLASSYYADLINPGFEEPTLPHSVIENISDPRQLESDLAALCAAPSAETHNHALQRSLRLSLSFDSLGE